MSELEKIDARDALREARQCCERLASVLDESAGEAEQFGDLEMMTRLASAKAAADRARMLIARLALIIEAEDSLAPQSSK
ncbi:MAG TPA: hypothetical protein VE820_08760 [Sphingomicrobium sp.]|nr:hypothetical protein [Sphingomicrobium sp.]